MIADRLIYRIGTLYTPNQKPPVKGKDMKMIQTYSHAFIAIKEGKIIGIGEGDGDSFKGECTDIIDAKGAVVLPGLIDSHTHLVHAGSREDEYHELQKGIPYLDILKHGGGILGTVHKTRMATCEMLYHQARHSLDTMMLHGTTVVESKSGYGLDYENESKQLRVNRKLDETHPIRMISTYMGAHAIPKEFSHDKDAYIADMLTDMEMIYRDGMAEAVDVFCEEGVFSLSDTKKILREAKALGFKIKMHADEIHPLGGAGLGVELGCKSVDHLMAISDADIQLLASSNTIANLLPGTSFFLKKPYANARKMIDQGVAISMATDYNPGSSPTENLQFIMHLASNQMGLHPEEILNAVTINASYHLDLSDKKGSLEIGKDADFIVLDIPNLAYLMYHYGINHVRDVFILGKYVVKDQKIVRD
ncbi:MAG: imidazolonepropionase [Acholeplasma sp.]|nr:MAG: imidazolonepropionase [Acholeplasma sp.]